MSMISQTPQEEKSANAEAQQKQPEAIQDPFRKPAGDTGLRVLTEGSEWLVHDLENRANLMHNYILVSDFLPLEYMLSDFCKAPVCQHRVDNSTAARIMLSRSPKMIAEAFLNFTISSKPWNGHDLMHICRAGACFTILTRDANIVRRLPDVLVMLYFRTLLRYIILQLIMSAEGGMEQVSVAWEHWNIQSTAAMLIQFLRLRSDIFKELAHCIMNETVRFGAVVGEQVALVELRLRDSLPFFVQVVQDAGRLEILEETDIMALLLLLYNLFIKIPTYPPSAQMLAEAISITDDVIKAHPSKLLGTDHTLCLNCLKHAPDREITKRSMRLCGNCALATYCSISCQTEHWKASHKKLCSRMNTSTLRDCTERLPATLDEQLAKAIAEEQAKCNHSRQSHG